MTVSLQQSVFGDGEEEDDDDDEKEQDDDDDEDEEEEEDDDDDDNDDEWKNMLAHVDHLSPPAVRRELYRFGAGTNRFALAAELGQMM